jgi:hypothetical protein
VHPWATSIRRKLRRNFSSSVALKAIVSSQKKKFEWGITEGVEKWMRISEYEDLAWTKVVSHTMR